MSPRREAVDASTSALVPTTGTPDTALVMADDVRADLLRAQRGMIDERQRLPQVRIMAAGVALYEFSDTHETVRDFQGIVLGAHPRNVLWDKPYGQQGNGQEQAAVPACSSNDGKFGIPRQGFRHAALRGAVATGSERISCRECPYNNWGSKGLIPELLRAGETVETVKGKAVVNQRAVYVAVEGRLAPVELILPPTSITAFDEYLAVLLNRNIPVQAVLTTFTQEVKSRGQLRWGQAKYEQGDSLSRDAFSRVLAMRQEWLPTIEGTHEEMVVAADVAEPGDIGGGEDDEEIPF